MPRAHRRERQSSSSHDRPGLNDFRPRAGRVRDTTVAMERVGKPVGYRRAAIVPADELLCVLEAGTQELAREG
jgi:hypothetical protein